MKLRTPHLMCVLMLSMGLSQTASAQFKSDALRISGFGTIGIATSADSNYAFRSNTQQSVGTHRTWDMGVDSKFGLQANYALTDQISLVTQAVAKRKTEQDIEASVNWLYVRYSPNDSWSVLAGKMQSPFLALADSTNISYTYPWVRLPIEGYSFTNPESVAIRVDHRTKLKDFDITGFAFYGKADDVKNTKTNTVDYKPLWSIGVGTESDNLTTRLSYTKTTASATSPDITALQGCLTAKTRNAFGPGTCTTPQPFFAAASDGTNRVYAYTDAYVNYTYGNWQFISEAARTAFDAGINPYQQQFNTYFVSASYRVGKFTPYVVHGSLKFKGDTVETRGDRFFINPVFTSILSGSKSVQQSTNTIGVRFDAATNIAIKAQWDMIKRDPNTPGLLKIVPGAPKTTDGKTNVASVSLDFVF
jgi:hypothetical protein